MPAHFAPSLQFLAASRLATRGFSDSAAAENAVTTPFAALTTPPPANRAPTPAGTMTEDQLIHRLFQATQQSLLVRGLCAGLDQILQQSAGRVGYSMQAARDLHWPVMIAVQRNSDHNQLSENLAVVQAGLLGNLRYQSATTHFSTTQSTPAIVRQVLGDLHRKACQLHLV